MRIVGGEISEGKCCRELSGGGRIKGGSGWRKCRDTEYFSHKYNNHLFASKELLHYNRQKGVEYDLVLNL